MRRKTSAWTTAIVGSLLTASMASAQQSTAPTNRSRNRTTAQDENDPASTYGASVNRGARYLLRNGLDYLSYQQYERALKFLRDAESKQKELNSAEKLSLKQGIERAQRGLREAVDAEKPYALSERSQRKSGFRAAKPETALAARDQAGSPGTKATRATKHIPPPLKDDDEGEPIRLASNETIADDPAPNTTPESTEAETPRGTSRSMAAMRPRSLPEIPQLPSVDSPPPLDSEVATSKSTSRTREDQLALARVEASEPPAPFDPPKMTSPVAAQAPPATALSPGLTPTSISGPAPTSVGMKQPTSAGPAVIELETIAPKAVANPPAAPESTPPTVQEATPTPLAVDPPPSIAPTEPSPVTPAQTAPAPTQTTASPAPEPDQAPSLAPAPTPLTNEPTAGAAIELPTLPAATQPEPAATQAPAPEPAASQPTMDLPPLPDATRPAEPAPATTRPSQPRVAPATNEPPASNDLPLLPQDLSSAAASPSPSPAAEVPSTAPSQATTPAPSVPAANEALPQLPETPVQSSTPVAIAMSAPVADQAAPAIQPEPAQTTLPALPEAATQPPTAVTNPEPPAESAAPRRATPPRMAGGASELDSLLPRRPAPPSTLRPELQREVERIARKQDEILQRQAPAQDRPPVDSADSAEGDLRIQSQIDISRAPSPAEARPIKAIPVPEDWVPLSPRTWSPQSKYWAAAATCHLPLYFQDPVLERYGHSVEQLVGPWGRYLTYPVDDPTQSTQRNQIIQPFFSIGLFAMQIIAGPYNLVMDPPWEAQYDLGYYRPGDDVPTDLYWLPLHGYGPPLRGNRY